MDIEPNTVNSSKLPESNHFIVFPFNSYLEIISLKPDQEYRVHISHDDKIEINV